MTDIVERLDKARDAVYLMPEHRLGRDPALESAVDVMSDASEEITRLRAALAAEREECAKVAEQQAVDFLSPEYATGQPLSSLSERFACKQVAAAIRARGTP